MEEERKNRTEVDDSFRKHQQGLVALLFSFSYLPRASPFCFFSRIFQLYAGDRNVIGRDTAENHNPQDKRLPLIGLIFLPPEVRL